MQHIPKPMAETQKERLVKPELVVNTGDIRCRCYVAGDDRRGIAGGDVKQREDENGDNAHNRDRRQ